MGNALSSTSTGKADATNSVSESETMNDTGSSSDNEAHCRNEFHDADDGLEKSRAKAKEDALAEFKNELNIKREQRKAILARHRTEKGELEKSLAQERKTNLDLCETNRLLRELLLENNVVVPEELNSTTENAEVESVIGSMNVELEKLSSNNLRLRRELAEANHSLQGAYSDIADLHAQQTESIKHINALKEVISVSKTMIGLREQQLEELKLKLGEIERSLADREASMLSSDLREEYERQLQNIRTLRGLYEERARLAEVTRQGLLREIEEQKGYYQIEINKSKELNTKVEDLETELNDLKETVENKNDEIRALHEETRGLQAEMSSVNKLFSQILPGYKNRQDLDKLANRLEENHGILTHMAEKENDFEASSALPKLLLELVSQVDDAEEKRDILGENKDGDGKKDDQKSLAYTTESTDTNGSEEVTPNAPSNTTAEEIVENLPKVWRVLLELLSHQNVADTSTTEKVTTCYKSVETKSGPVLVPSVSQTYIRLKDLIIEKLSLIKEVHRMKQLNSHLENRLGEQEKRLCLVTTELSKTWHVVGRLRRHHHQLHTHEKILKYELQQKRKLLNELKEELEYCREKWDQAREKNNQSEKDCKKLRAEFSSRKIKSIPTSCHNSAESGYSDERPSDDSSDSNDENEPLVRCKKKIAKSFETIHDSSTDVHVAEREDPVSDMIDVADLSLDTQDGDENRESSISECCNSEDILKSEKDVVETEDEAGDIGNEFCVEIPFNVKNENNTSSDNAANIGTSAVSQTIKCLNEQPLVKQDTELEYSDNNNSQQVANRGESMSNETEISINRPSTSHTDVKIDNSEIHLPVLDQNIEYGNDEQVKFQQTKQITHTDSSGYDEAGMNKIFTPTINNQISQDKSSYSQTVTITTFVKSNASGFNDSNNKEQSTDTKLVLDNIPEIDPQAIMESIKRQNERLAKRDKKLESLEKGSESLLKKSQNTVKLGETLNETLDHLINRPNSEQHEPNNRNLVNDVENCTSLFPSDQTLKNDDTEESLSSDKQEDLTAENAISTKPNHDNCETSCSQNNTDLNDFSVTATDSKAILDSIKKQNERLVNKDKRLKDLEEGCSDVVTNITSILNSGDAMIQKMDAIHSELGNVDDSSEENSFVENLPKEAEASTSADVDHEARFAARDIRLKRLEEQTKSLVNKMNKTNSKGVKINYKLEELHNIYGSVEGSRAGTPSEANDDEGEADEDEVNDES